MTKFNFNILLQKKRAFYSISFLVLILTGLISLFSPVKNLELKSLDFRFHLRGPLAQIDTSIVIVTIDDQTFNSIPQKWPYPRSYYAKLIQNLHEAGARLIVFDLEFTDPTLDDLSQDEELARAAREAGNVIFAGKLVTEFGSSMTVNRYPLPPIQQISNPPAPLSPLPWGIVNIVEDEDGFLRRYFLSKSINEKRYLPLAVLAAKQYLHIRDAEIQDKPDAFILGDIRIPKETSETILINFAGPTKTFNTYSFSNILDDFTFDLYDGEDTDIFELHKMWGTFEDKIVFVGSSAEELQDTKFVPFFNYDGVKRKMPGVEVHANALNTILTGEFLASAPFWLILIFLLCFVSSIGWLVTRSKPTVSGIITLAAVLLYFIFTVFCFSQYNFILPLVSPVVAMALSYVGNTAFQYATEQREKQRYRKIFQQYVSKDVVGQMLDSGNFPSFGGERKELTVLFSDIRQFTSFSERYSPEDIVHRLSEYLSEMTDLIIQHEGTLDKFVGDEIMAIFGAPLLYTNHAEKACRAAYDMMKKLKELGQEYKNQNGGEYFNIGIGINTGEMVVGNLGSRQLFDYTVIGDAVNLGARLEGLNKFYGTNVLISKNTVKAAGEKVITRELDRVQVKGKEEPVRVYELLGVDSIAEMKIKLLIDSYQQGLHYYYRKEWYKCLKEMRQVLKYFPDDGPAKIFIRRCLDYIENPPEKYWQHLFKFEVK